MSQTVIALYDTFETARRVVEDLVDAGFPRENISLIASDAKGEYSRHLTTSGVTHDDDDVSAGEGAGFGAVVGALIGLGAALIPGIGPVVAAGPLAAAAMAGIGAAAGAVTGGLAASLIDMGVPEDEAHLYAEGLRRGGTMVSVTTDEARVARAQDIMNRHNPIDLDERATSWRESGWSRHDDTAEPMTHDQIAAERSRYMTSDTTTDTSVRATGRTRDMDKEEATFPVVEEEIQVGKREVEGGGVRVRSFVTSTPVEEEVNLRQERVVVERNPVDRPASEADFTTFKEGTMEVTERREEAVVSKQARVVEEVVVGKDVEQHTETIRDSVRRTDVEVEQMGRTGTTGTTGSMTYQPFETYDSNFRKSYTTRYGSSGYTYEQYVPAYRYGYTLATNDMYRDSDWSRVEPEARRRWEERNPNTWEQFKDAIHDAWDAIRGRR